MRIAVQIAQLAAARFKFGGILLLSMIGFTLMLAQRQQALGKLAIEEQVAFQQVQSPGAEGYLQIHEDFERKRKELFEEDLELPGPLKLKVPVSVNLYSLLPWWPAALVLAYGVFRVLYVRQFLNVKEEDTGPEWQFLVLDAAITVALVGLAYECFSFYHPTRVLSARMFIADVATAFFAFLASTSSVIDEYAALQQRLAARGLNAPAGARIHLSIFEKVKQQSQWLKPRTSWGPIGAVCIFVSFFLPIVGFGNTQSSLYRLLTLDSLLHHPQNGFPFILLLAAIMVFVRWSIPGFRYKPAWLYCSWLLLFLTFGYAVLGCIQILAIFRTIDLLPFSYSQGFNIQGSGASITIGFHLMSKSLQITLWSIGVFVPALLLPYVWGKRQIAPGPATGFRVLLPRLYYQVVLAVLTFLAIWSFTGVGNLRWGVVIFLVGGIVSLTGLEVEFRSPGSKPPPNHEARLPRTDIGHESLPKEQHCGDSILRQRLNREP